MFFCCSRVVVSITHNPSAVALQKTKTLRALTSEARMARLTNVCFTLNDPQEELLFDPTVMLYLIYQLELSESGTPHFQGYMELKKPQSLAQIKVMLDCPHVHIEKRQGTAEQASDYCCKEDSYVPGGQRLKFGRMKPTAPGKRNDINEFKDAVMGEKKRKRELIDEHAGMIAKYPRFYNEMWAMIQPERVNELKVYLLIGPPGCGKTRSVHEAYKERKNDLWRAPVSNGTMWFDRYDGHPAALFDDFTGASTHMRLDNFLNIIDRYPLFVPIKGCHFWWMPDTIFITTNIYPRDWFKWENRAIQYQALARRFTAVFDFFEYEEGGDPPVGDNELMPYLHQDYIDHGISFAGCMCPPRYEGKTWWIREKPEEAIPW